MAQLALGSLQAQAQGYLTTLLKTPSSQEQEELLVRLIELVKSTQISPTEAQSGGSNTGNSTPSVSTVPSSDAASKWAEKVAASALAVLQSDAADATDRVAQRCGELSALGCGAGLWRAVFGPLRDASKPVGARLRLLRALEALVRHAAPRVLDTQVGPLAVNVLAALEHEALPPQLLAAAAHALAALAAAAPARFAAGHLDDAADVLLAHALTPALPLPPLAAVLEALSALAGLAGRTRPGPLLDLCEKLAADLAAAAPALAPRFLLAHLALLQGLAPHQPAAAAEAPRGLVRALVACYELLPAWPEAAPFLSAANRGILHLLATPAPSPAARSALLADAVRFVLLTQLCPAARGAYVPPPPALVHALTTGAALLRLLPPAAADATSWLLPVIGCVERVALSHPDAFVRAHGLALLRSMLRSQPESALPALRQRLRQFVPAVEPAVRSQAREARAVQLAASLVAVAAPHGEQVAAELQARAPRAGGGRSWALGRPVRHGMPALARALLATLMALQTQPPAEAVPLLLRALTPDAAPELRLCALQWLTGALEPAALPDALLTALLAALWAADTKVAQAATVALTHAVAALGGRVAGGFVARVLAAAVVRCREPVLQPACGRLLAACARWAERVPLEPAVFAPAPSASSTASRSGRSWRDEADAVLQLVLLPPVVRLPPMRPGQWTRGLQALQPSGDLSGPAAELSDALARAGAGDVSGGLAREWLPGQLARFVVAHRLRTPAGGPAQTFEAVERLMSAALAQAATQPARAAALLQLVARLERDVRSAIDAAAPVSPGSAAPNFFAANAKVCDEWFARLRPHALALAHAAGRPLDICYHGCARMLELQARGKLADAPAALVPLADALVLLRQPAELHGLAAWLRARDAAAPLAPLLEALADVAAGALEHARGALQVAVQRGDLPAPASALAQAHANDLRTRLSLWLPDVLAEPAPASPSVSVSTPLLRVRAALFDRSELPQAAAYGAAGGLALVLRWLPAVASPVASTTAERLRPDAAECDLLLRHLPPQASPAQLEALARLARLQRNFVLSRALVQRLPASLVRRRALLEAQLLRAEGQLPSALRVLAQPTQPAAGDLSAVALLVRQARWLRKSPSALPPGTEGAPSVQQLQAAAEAASGREAAAAWGELVHMHTRAARARHAPLQLAKGELADEISSLLRRHLDDRVPQPPRRREDALRTDLAALLARHSPSAPAPLLEAALAAWHTAHNALALHAEAAVNAAMRQEQLAPPAPLHQQLQHLRVLDLALQYGGAVARALANGLQSASTGWADAAQHALPRCGRADDADTEAALAAVVLRAAAAAPHVVLPAALPLLHEPAFAPLAAALRAARGPELAELEALRDALVPLAQLPEEHWAALLAHTHARVVAALRPLRDELAAHHDTSKPQRERRVRDRAALLLSPLVLHLRAQWTATLEVTASAHRRAFLRWFAPQLEAALERLVAAAAALAPTPAELDALWARSGMRELQKALHVRQTAWAGKLQLAALAPSLAHVTWHALQLPGAGGAAVRLVRASGDVGVLASKTKPKRLLLHAADGTRHDWLLKGRDDLQLDAACVRLLASLDQALAHAARPTAAPRPRVRHYAVLPLGAGAGLIQMLPQPCPSLLALVRRWKRHHWAPPAPEPALSAEAFFAAVLPRLRAAGAAAAARTEWPLSALTEAHAALASSLPAGELLARELLLAAPAPAAWAARVQTYAQSLGASSAAGYVAGLGDRHLDNVLLDPGAGELAHIDFNICLERGLRLRVPELVPFRLTPLLLGPLGVAAAQHGTFQYTLRATLAAARDSRELLLRLLAGHLHAAALAEPADVEPQPRERRGAELSAALNMLAARAPDLRTAATTGHQRLLAALHAIRALVPPLVRSHQAASAAAQELHEQTSAHAAGETRRQQLDQQLAAATASLQAAQAATQASDATLQQCRRALEDAQTKCARWQARHLRTLASLRALQLEPLSARLLAPPLPLRAPQSGTGSGVLATAVALEAQLREQLQAQHGAVRQLLEALGAHRADVVAAEPVEWDVLSRHGLWAHVLEQLLHAPADVAPAVLLAQLLAAADANVVRAAGPPPPAVATELEAAAAEASRLSRERAELDERCTAAHVRLHSLHRQLRTLPPAAVRAAVGSAAQELLESACASLAAQARADATAAADETPGALAAHTLAAVQALAAAVPGESSWGAVGREAAALADTALAGALAGLLAGVPSLLGPEVWRALESRDPSVPAAVRGLSELGRAPPAGLAAFVARYQALLQPAGGGGALLLAGFDHFFLPAENALLQRALMHGRAEDLARRLLEMKVASVAFVLEHLARYHTLYEAQRAVDPAVPCQADAVAAAAISAALSAYAAGYGAHALLPLLRARLPEEAVPDDPETERLLADLLAALRDARALEDEVLEAERRLQALQPDQLRLSAALARAHLLHRSPQPAARLAAMQAALSSLHALAPQLSTSLQQYAAVRSELAQEVLLAGAPLQQAVARAGLVLEPEGEAARQEQLQQVVKLADALLDVEAVRAAPGAALPKLQQLDTAHHALVALHQDAWLAARQATAQLQEAHAACQRAAHEREHNRPVLPVSAAAQAQLAALQGDAAQQLAAIRRLAQAEAAQCGISLAGRLSLFGGDDLALLLAPIVASTSTAHTRIHDLASRLLHLLARIDSRAAVLFPWLLGPDPPANLDVVDLRVQRLCRDIAQLEPVFERLAESVANHLRATRDKSHLQRPVEVRADEEAASQDDVGVDEASSSSGSDDDEDDSDVIAVDEDAADLEAEEIEKKRELELKASVLEVKVEQKASPSLRVLARLKARLSGKDAMWASRSPAAGAPNLASALSVEVQAEHLIRQATSVDNLAKMYEGWTAWI